VYAINSKLLRHIPVYKEVIKSGKEFSPGQVSIAAEDDNIGGY
jgi:hypothetical protein